MKAKALLFLFLATSVSSQAITISQWTFETAPPADLNNSTSISGINADIGNGSASGVHASAATDWSTPQGNGSANSLSVQTWTVGDYWQFQVSTLGFQNISLSWDQAGSSTGPRDFVLQYSTDATSFAQVGSAYQVALNDWSNAAFHNGFTITSDLSGISLLVANQANVYFRLVNNSTTSIGGGTVVGGGTERIDNFTVSGDVYSPSTASVPDSLPTGFAAATLLGLLIFARRLDLGNPALAKNNVNDRP